MSRLEDARQQGPPVDANACTGFSQPASGLHNMEPTMGWSGIGGRTFSPDEEAAIRNNLRSGTPAEDWLPSATSLANADALQVLDVHGHVKTFGELRRASAPDQRHLIVFVRQFSCPV